MSQLLKISQEVRNKLYTIALIEKLRRMKKTQQEPTEDPSKFQGWTTKPGIIIKYSFKASNIRQTVSDDFF